MEIIVETYYANIFLGLKVRATGWKHLVWEVEDTCQEYVNKIGLCVTVTPTEYIYTDGNEPGVIVGLINYPRFPEYPEQIRKKAVQLAYILKERFDQLKVTVMCPDQTIMIGGESD